MSIVSQALEELRTHQSWDLPPGIFVIADLLYVPKEFVEDRHFALFTYYLKEEVEMLDGGVEVVDVPLVLYQEFEDHYGFQRGDLEKLMELWPQMFEEGKLIDQRSSKPMTIDLKMREDFEYRTYEYKGGIKEADLNVEGSVRDLIKTINSASREELITMTLNQGDALDRFLDPNIGGIFKAFPGFGKTVLMTVIMCRLGMRVLLLAHKNDLLTQFMDTVREMTNIDDFIDEDGFCYNMYKLDKKWDIPNIGVSTFAYLNKNPEYLHDIQNEYGVVFVDECHRLGSESYTQVFLHINAMLRFGFSATPFRKDGMDIIFQDIIGKTRINLPSPPKDCVAFIHDTGVAVPPHYGSYQFPMNATHKYLAFNEHRLRMICTQIIKDVMAGRAILVLTYRINAIDSIYYELIDQINEWVSNDPSWDYLHQDDIEWIYSNFTDADRKGVKERMTARTSKIVITTSQLFGEGSDMPVLDTLYWTYPASNKREIEQVIGRITREYPDKPTQHIHFYRDVGLPQVMGMAKGWANYVEYLGVAVQDERKKENNNKKRSLFGPKKN